MNLQTDILSETYVDLQKLIYKLCHTYSHRYSIAYEDVLSYAHLSFVKAVKSYKKSRGSKLSTWVTFCLFNDLTTALKKEYRHRDYEEINNEVVGSYENSTFASDFRDELSADGQFILDLVLQETSALDITCHDRKVKNKTQYLQVLNYYLTAIGWSGVRIKAATNEIKFGLKYTSND